MVSQVFWWAAVAGGGVCVAALLLALVTGRPPGDDRPRPGATPAVVRLRVALPFGVSALLTLKALRQVLDPSTAGILDAGTVAALAVIGFGLAARVADRVRRGRDAQRAG